MRRRVAHHKLLHQRLGLGDGALRGVRLVEHRLVAVHKTDQDRGQRALQREEAFGEGGRAHHDPPFVRGVDLEVVAVGGMQPEQPGAVVVRPRVRHVHALAQPLPELLRLHPAGRRQLSAPLHHQHRLHDLTLHDRAVAVAARSRVLRRRPFQRLELGLPVDPGEGVALQRSPDLDQPVTLLLRDALHSAVVRDGRVFEHGAHHLREVLHRLDLLELRLLLRALPLAEALEDLDEERVAHLHLELLLRVAVAVPRHHHNAPQLFFRLLVAGG